MAEPIPFTFLVIPCYRESRRLPPFLRELCHTLEPLAGTLQIQIVDDGSPADERDALVATVDRLREETGTGLLEPVLCASHLGKGGAILNGWKEAPAQTQLYAFVDADGAVPAEEVLRLCASEIPELYDSRASYFAIRRNTPSTLVRRNPVRRLMGRTYARLINFILESRIYDSACGFKLISSAFYEHYGETLSEVGWALDLELVARHRIHGFPVVEIPISWEEKGGSKIVSGDSLRILARLFLIKWRSLKW